MQKIAVTGGKMLHGAVDIHGAKNSVLPILAATILCRTPCVLQNCPRLSDVEATVQILRCLGCKAKQTGDAIFIDPRGVKNCCVPPKLAGKMRSSVLFLGAMLARFGGARLPMPGGCRLGRRPIDYHLQAFAELGIAAEQEEDSVSCKVKAWRPGKIVLPFASVGATENAILAAMGCPGEVTIYNAAREPEIADLAGFLNCCGGCVLGAGSDTIVINGGRSLHGAEYQIMPDRIETATYLCAAAGCGGEVWLHKTDGHFLMPVIDILQTCGCEVQVQKDTIRISGRAIEAPKREIITRPYPGFPTDAQAPMMAALLEADGQSVFRETLFDDRYHHVLEFIRCGAAICLQKERAVVQGVAHLRGCKLCAEDLRGGAALVLAALQAEGDSEISGRNHILRGYEAFEENLRTLGAEILVKT